MKKLLFLLLLVMLSPALRAKTLELNEESPWVYRVLDNNNIAIIGTRDSVRGPLIIPSTIEANGITYNVTEIRSSSPNSGGPIIGAFQGCNTITSVTIPSSVKKIDYRSFYGCKNLTRLGLSVGLEEIGAEAFYGCSNLRGDLLLPKTLKRIQYCAFGNCPFDGTLTVGAQEPTDGSFLFNSTSTYMYEDYPFTNCKFNKIVLEGERPAALDNTSFILRYENAHSYVQYQVKNHSSGIKEALSGTAVTLEISPDVKELADYALTGINLSNSNSATLLSHVEKIGKYAFQGTKLNGDLIIPTTVKSIDDNAFYGNQFQTIKFSTPSSLTTIGDYAFYLREPQNVSDPINLNNELIIPSSVQRIGSSSFQNVPLKSLDLTNATSLKEIGGGAFANCILNGAHIKIPGNVNKLGGAFGGNKIASIEIEEGDLEIINPGFAKDNPLLTQIELPKKIKEIRNNAFENCTSLVNVQLPINLHKIGNEAFKGCTNLETITPLPNNIETIGAQAFVGCDKLKADASELLPSSLKEIAGTAFNNIKGITGEVIFPDNNISITPVNPFLGTNVHGIRMNKGLNYFNQIGKDSPLPEPWPNNANLFYIDSHKCTVFIGTDKTYNDEVYKFTRKRINNTQYAEFNNLSVNTIVYLPSNETFNVGNLPHKNFEDRFTDEGAENFVMDGKCEHFFVKDGLPYRIPYSFTALEAKYDRVFSPTGGKNVSTLYLPYPTDLPTGMKAYELVEKGFDINGVKAFIFKQVSTPLRANTPYLVQVTDGATHTLPTMYNVEVPASPCFDNDSKYIAPGYKRSFLHATSTADWNFYGTTERINNDEAYTEKAFYLNGSQWWSVNQNVENDYIAPFRCFISSPNGSVAAKSFMMVLDGGENTTNSINELENNTNNDIQSGHYPFYTTDGKLAGHDYNALTRGQIYIVNGKKFYKF